MTAPAHSSAGSSALAVLLSFGFHGAVFGGLWLFAWLSADATPPRRECATRCAFVEPETSAGAPDDCELEEFDPVEVESLELPTVADLEVPDTVLLPDPLPIDDRRLETPSLTVTPRMFERPRPTPPLARPSPVTSVLVRVAPPRRPLDAPSGGRLEALHMPPAARYYPREARRRGIQGTTTVVVTVDAEGRVIDVEVAKSSGSKLLDDAAVRLMYDARFAPPGTETRAKAPVNFILR